MPERLTITACLCLAWSIPVAAAFVDGGSVEVRRQGAASKQTSDQDTQAKKTGDGATARKKPAARAKAAAKKKADRDNAPKKAAGKADGLDLGTLVVCKSIDGFEDYKPLPGAAQTSDEKLLIYIRPTGYLIEKVEKGYQAHLTTDGELRKSGAKTILLQKKKLLEYKPLYTDAHEHIYLKQTISLKGLAPGAYELTIILHDELAKGASATQVVKFKVIPAFDPSKVKEPPVPHELDALYAPFMEIDVPDPNDD